MGQASASNESEPEAERTQRDAKGEMSSSDQSEPGNESDYKVLLVRLTKYLYLHGQRAARHGRVDRLEKLVELLVSLPKEVQETIELINVRHPKERFAPFEMMVEAAVNGCVESVRFLYENAHYKNSEIKYAARMAFLFQPTDVMEAFAELGMNMDEDVFLCDVLALKRTPGAGLIPWGAPSSCTDAEESCSRHLALLKAALRGDQTQVVQCLDEVESTGAKPDGYRSKSKDEADYWMECYRLVLRNERLAPTKKDAIINISIMFAIARGHHQALRVLLDQAGSTWKDNIMLGEPVSIAQFDTTPMNLAVLSGNVQTVQVFLFRVQSLSVFPGFLFDAIMHERLDIVRYLVKRAKALINGAGNVHMYFRSLLLKALYCALFTAIERLSRSVVKLIFEEFKRGELLFDNVGDGYVDQCVQDSKSLPILRAFLLWCPDYIKNKLQIKPKLAEVWQLGYRCLLEAKGKEENRSDIPEGSDSEDEFQLG